MPFRNKTKYKSRKFSFRNKIVLNLLCRIYFSAWQWVLNNVVRDEKTRSGRDVLQTDAKIPWTEHMNDEEVFLKKWELERRPYLKSERQLKFLRNIMKKDGSEKLILIWRIKKRMDIRKPWETYLWCLFEWMAEQGHRCMATSCLDIQEAVASHDHQYPQRTQHINNDVRVA